MLERPDAALRSLALLPAEPFIEVGAAEHFVQDAVRARAHLAVPALRNLTTGPAETHLVKKAAVRTLLPVPNVSADSGNWTLYRSGQPLRRYALLLHGSLRQRKPFVPFCAATQLEMIVRANADDGGVDVFLHSWDAQRGGGLDAAGIDALYGSALRASLHEPSYKGLPKGASQALSIARGATRIVQFARAAAHSYETVLTMRHDLLVSAPMHLASFDGAHVWLAQKCCQRFADEGVEREALRQTCGADDASLNVPWRGAWRNRFVTHCTVSQYQAGRRLDPTVDAAYFVLDWWIAARAETLASWRRIPEQWPSYMSLAQRLGIHEVTASPEYLWSHFLWPMHLHDVLNATATIRFAPSAVSIPKLVIPQLRTGACPYSKSWMARLRFAGGAPPPAAVLPAAAPRGFGARFAPMAAQCPIASNLGVLEDGDGDVELDAGTMCCGENRMCGDRGEHAAFCAQHRQALLVLANASNARYVFPPPVAAAPASARSAPAGEELLSTPCDDQRRGCPPQRLPSIYIHDPGELYNARAMADPREGWNNTDHNWCVAYWLHQGLLRYRRRVYDVEEADVVFIALYGQYHNPKSAYLRFGRAMYDWPQVLRQGPAALFGNSSALLRRWEARPLDFTVAAVLKACQSLSPSFLKDARWIITDVWFRRCQLRDGVDFVAPQVLSLPEWRPPDDDDVVVDEEERRRGSAGPRFFLLYIGKVCKPYIEPPASTLRFALWSVLRAHPNATFRATDHLWQASINASDPAAPPPCRQCSYGCKQCLRLPAESAQVPLSVGLLGRRMAPPEYLSYLRNATFCLVPRGDNEMTRKFTEAIVAGCIPVMIVDMPALPFERRLDYAAFSYEFDLKKVLERPMLVMETLLRVPAAEVRAKRRALLRVRRHFFYHDDPNRPGAVQQLIYDMGTAVSTAGSLTDRRPN